MRLKMWWINFFKITIMGVCFSSCLQERSETFTTNEGDIRIETNKVVRGQDTLVSSIIHRSDGLIEETHFFNEQPAGPRILRNKKGQILQKSYFSIDTSGNSLSRNDFLFFRDDDFSKLTEFKSVEAGVVISIPKKMSWEWHENGEIKIGYEMEGKLLVESHYNQVNELVEARKFIGKNIDKGRVRWEFAK